MLPPEAPGPVAALIWPALVIESGLGPPRPSVIVIEVIVGVEAAGGSVHFRPRAGGRTEVTVTVSDHIDSEPG